MLTCCTVGYGGFSQCIQDNELQKKDLFQLNVIARLII